MGQKIKPTLFQLEKIDIWDSKYSEKKIIECSVYSKQNLELWAFIFKFFENYNMIVQNCKINYSNKVMQIFISYYPSPHCPTSKTFEEKKNKKAKIQKNPYNYYKQKKALYFKKILTTEILRSCTLKKTKNFITNTIIKNFLESILHFTKKKFKIFLVLEKSTLKKKVEQKFKKKLLKKTLASFRRYKQEKFLKKNISTLFMCAFQKKLSKCLANFIAKKLKRFKKHNFFLKFVKNILTILKNKTSLTFKGIKIKISGRLNGRPRARHKIINIGDSISNLNLNSNINYTENTAFTWNGTLGIKIWVSEK